MFPVIRHAQIIYWHELMNGVLNQAFDDMKSVGTDL